MSGSKGQLLEHDTKIYYLKKYRQFWASGPAAALAVVIGSPLENLKTRMQSHNFPSALSAARFVYHNEGIRGFWAGTFAPLISITAYRVAGFVVYRKAKYEIDHIYENATGHSPLQWVNEPGTYPRLSTVICFSTAGMVQGAILTPFLSPFELLKNASQTAVLMSTKDAPENRPSNSKANRVSTWGAAKQIVQLRGVRALWTGTSLHLARDMIGGGVYFGVYESVKQALGSFYGDEMKNTPWAIPFAGAVCGIASWIVTYPIDTMKTRAQNNLLNPKQVTSEAVKNSLRTAAKAGRWKGIEMVILRTAIQNMIQMTAFEQVKVLIDNSRFTNGSATIEGMIREKGRDRRI